MALTKISSNLVADDAIVTGKIADGGVATADLAANAVTTAKIAQNNVTAHHIADGSITTTQLGADAVTAAKMADDAVSEEHLDKTIISDMTQVTPVAGDFVLIGDTSDSNNLKKAPISGITALVSSGAAADDITTGDAAVTLATSSGNITIDAQGSDTDIIFKGTDGSSDITALTLDMSTKGRATFNEYVVLGEANDARIYFNASSGYSPRLQSSTNTLSIYTNDTERVNIDNDGNVRIGVDTGDAFNTTSPLRIGQTTNAYINIKAGTSHNGGILVGDSDDDFMGGFIYSNNTNSLGLYANNAVKFTLGPGEGVAGFGAGSGDFAGSMLISNDGGTGTLNNAYYNTGFGWEVFDDLTTGDSNTVIGNQAGYKLNEATGCTLIGRLAGEKLETGSYNTALGYNSMGDGVVTGASNTALGNSVMVAVTSGEGNTAVGEACAAGLTTGSNNVAIGRSAMSNAAVTGTFNIGVGYEALRAVTSGSENICMGRDAGHDITSANQNVAIGHESLTKNSTATGNVAVGFQAGENCTGGGNVFIGYKAGEAQEGGVYNIMIGDATAGTHPSHSQAIAIGRNIDAAPGEVAIGTSGLGKIHCTFSSNATWSRSSDERLKQDITTSTLGLDFINNLRPVTYKWKPNNELPKELPMYQEENEKDTDTVMTGLVAQEVKAAIDSSGVNGFGAWGEDIHGVQHISDALFVYPLIKAVQELKTKLEAAEARIEKLES